MKITTYCLFILSLLIIPQYCHGQSRNSYCVGFYNFENLFDTINNEGVRDGEFTPEGSKEWNVERYENKLAKLSVVISEIGADEGFRKGPDVLGICEVENRGVLEDLIKQKNIRRSKYQIVHYDSPDKRGIDVALLFRAESFELSSSKPYTLYLTDPVTGRRIYTRDQLLVTGDLNGQKVHILVNHWPSRWGGHLQSQPLRLGAAQLSRHIVDSLVKTDSLAQVIVMGDLNDDPTDISVEQYLYAAVDSSDLKKKQLYNASAEQFLNSEGSLKYRGAWNMFDQIILTQPILNKENTPLTLKSFSVFSRPYLFQEDGPFEGYPLRTYGGKNYLNGYSDHLPVYIILETDK